MIWYKDEDIKRLSVEHDKAIDEENVNIIEELINESLEIASDEGKRPMIRANCYYFIATSVSELLRINKIKGDEYEKNTEKTLYFYRESINLQDLYLENAENIDRKEIANINAIYNSSVVNYSNVLSSLGRIPAAIDAVSKSAQRGFGMAIGNLGGYLKHYADVDYDAGHRTYHYIEKIKLMTLAFKSTDPNVYSYARNAFAKDIKATLSILKGVSFDKINNETALFFNTVDILDWYDTFLNEEDRYLTGKLSIVCL